MGERGVEGKMSFLRFVFSFLPRRAARPAAYNEEIGQRKVATDRPPRHDRARSRAGMWYRRVSRRRSPTCMCARFFWSWRKKKEQSHTSRCARQLHLPGLLLYHDARRSKWGVSGGLHMTEWTFVRFLRISCGDALMPERNGSTDLEANRPNCHFYLFPFASRRGGSAAIYMCRDRDGRTSAKPTGDKTRSGWSVANWSCVSRLRSRFRMWCAVVTLLFRLIYPGQKRETVNWNAEFTGRPNGGAYCSRFDRHRIRVSSLEDRFSELSLYGRMVGRWSRRLMCERSCCRCCYCCYNCSYSSFSLSLSDMRGFLFFLFFFLLGMIYAIAFGRTMREGTIPHSRRENPEQAR